MKHILIFVAIMCCGFGFTTPMALADVTGAVANTSPVAKDGQRPAAPNLKFPIVHPVSADPEIDPFVANCDQLAAGYAFREELDARGFKVVPLRAIDSKAALAACGAALDAHPTHLRSKFHYARALERSSLISLFPTEEDPELAFQVMELYQELCTEKIAMACHNAASNKLTLRLFGEASTELNAACHMDKSEGAGASCAALGLMYENGDVPQKKSNLDSALVLYTLGCSLRYPFACADAARLTFEIDESVEGWAKAIAFAEKGCAMGANEGAGVSCTKLALLHSYQWIEGFADRALALTLFERGCGFGSPMACIEGARLAEKQPFFDYPKAVHLAEMGCNLETQVDSDISCLFAGYRYEGRNRTKQLKPGETIDAAAEARIALQFFEKACARKNARGCAAGAEQAMSEMILDFDNAIRLANLGCRHAIGPDVQLACEMVDKIPAASLDLLQSVADFEKHIARRAISHCFYKLQEDCLVMAMLLESQPGPKNLPAKLFFLQRACDLNSCERLLKFYIENGSVNDTVENTAVQIERIVKFTRPDLYMIKYKYLAEAFGKLGAEDPHFSLAIKRIEYSIQVQM